ncbi:hypothetical protein FRC17_002604 [Serendipita sp. 399]|nr:hypothetical protein FRC17_002604 [Serendipita sp. 399]
MKPILISLIYYLFILALPSSVYSSPVPAEPHGADPPPEAGAGPSRRRTRGSTAAGAAAGAATAAGGGTSSLQLPAAGPASGRNLRSSTSSSLLRVPNTNPDPAPDTSNGGAARRVKSTSNLKGKKPYTKSPSASQPGSQANTPFPPSTPKQEAIMGTGDQSLEASVPQASHDFLHATRDALDKACQQIQDDLVGFINKFHANCIRQGNDVCNPDERGLTNRLYMAITDNNAGYMPPDSAGEATTGADSFHAIRFIEDDGTEVLSYWQAKLLKFPKKDDLQNGKGVIEFTQKNANDMQMLLLDAKVREERAKYKNTVAVVAFYIIYTSTEVFAVPNNYVLTWCAGAKKLADCRKDRVQPKRKITEEVMQRYAKKEKCFLKYIREYVKSGGRDPLSLSALVAALPNQPDPSSVAGPSGLAGSSGASGSS